MAGELEHLGEALARATTDWDAAVAVFRRHVRSRFLEGFVADHLRRAADDADHVVPRGVGQGSFTFLDTPDFEYSVRVIAPFSDEPRPVKWVGMPQAVAVRGPGTLSVGLVTVPARLDIETFVAGEKLTHVTVRKAADGDVLVKGPREILDIRTADGPTVLEILTYRRAAPSIVWTFTPELRSIYAEQASLIASRLRNVLAVAQAFGHPIPDDIYDLSLASSSAHVAVLAVRSMLATRHPDAFAALHRIMDSEHASVRTGASDLLNTLLEAR